MRADGGGKLRDRLDAVIHSEPTRSPIEGRKVVRLQTEHGHAQRLQHLKGPRQVEDRFGARTDHGDRHTPQRGEVGRHIPAFGSPTMYAADAAGRENANPIHMRGMHRRGNRRRAQSAGRDHGCKIAQIRLADTGRCRELVELLARDADADRASQDANGGGRRRRLANLLFERKGSCDPVGVRQTVSHQGRFKRHDRRPRRERVRHRLTERVQLVHGFTSSPYHQGGCHDKSSSAANARAIAPTAPRSSGLLQCPPCFIAEPTM